MSENSQSTKIPHTERRFSHRELSSRLSNVFSTISISSLLTLWDEVSVETCWNDGKRRLLTLLTNFDFFLYLALFCMQIQSGSCVIQISGFSIASTYEVFSNNGFNWQSFLIKIRDGLK